MDDAEVVVAELFERLSRYPASAYPVQHATTRFHLGVALLQCGRAEEAEGSLRDAARVFERRLPLEYAKAQKPTRKTSCRLPARRQSSDDRPQSARPLRTRCLRSWPPVPLGR